MRTFVSVVMEQAAAAAGWLAQCKTCCLPCQHYFWIPAAAAAGI